MSVKRLISLRFNFAPVIFFLLVEPCLEFRCELVALDGCGEVVVDVAFLESIFVDEKKFDKLAWFLNVVLHKSLISKHLGRAAGRAPVSR
ncbi:hypothetical protein EBU99_14965 [bacterium]|nr:hypothetical protein [bacterium]